MKVLLLLSLLLFSLKGFAQVKIEGVLFEKGTRIPMKEATLFLLPHKLKAETDSKGNFVFESVPEGDFEIVVNRSGYIRLDEKSSTAVWEKQTLYLEREEYTGFETTIVGQKQKRDETRKTLTQKEFLNMPGAQGDPVKAVQNLPGVSRVNGFSSNVVIQGSAPGDTVYDLDGHQIPIVFHFGGLTSVVMPEAVGAVDYLSAGYGPEYSKAMGGVISLKTREPDVAERDQKGFFFVDNLKTGGLFEKKIDDHQSILVSGRYSYIGYFLRAVVKDNDAFDLTVAPEFADLTVIYKNKISESDDFKTSFVASRDTLEFLLKEPAKTNPSIRGNFKNETSFYRIIPQWTHKLDVERTAKLSAGAGQDRIFIDVGDNFFDLRTLELSVRGDWEQNVSKLWKYQLGMDHVFTQANLKFRLPYFSNEGGVSSPVNANTTREAEINTQINNLGFYMRNELTPDERWTYLPSLRADYFGLPKESVAAPRFQARYKWSEGLTLKGATGIYYQPPTGQQASAEYGNPDVKSSNVIHYMLGFEKDFREGRSDGWQWSGQFFRRDFDKLVISSSDTVTRDGATVPEVYNNKGKGRAQGFETQVKYDMAPWKGFVSYTISESKRWDPKRSEYPFQYDQTHNFNVVTTYDCGKNWQFSGRYRYVTGNPYTPVVGATYDADTDAYIPIKGGFYSERNSPFQQLDFRVDKKWITNTEIWSLYLDIQNVLNIKNSEGVRYSYDYSKKQDVTGLPILPAIGLKGEF